ncbi:MAG: MlaD family protein [Planctomycetota bacterium]
MSDKNAIIAGGFILLSIALLVSVIVGVRGAQGLMAESREYAVVFDISDDVGGLKPGSDVRVGGLRLGTVTSITFTTDEVDTPVILARFTLPADVPLGQGADVGIQATVTGVSWLNVAGLGDAQQLLGPTDFVDGTPNTLTQLLASLNELAPEMTGTVRDIREVTVPKVNDSVDAFGALAARVDAEIATPIANAAASTERLTDTLNARLPQSLDKVDRFTDAGGDVLEETAGILGDGGTGDIRSTLSNIADVTGTAKDRLPGAFDRIETLIDDTTARVKQAESVLDEVQVLASDAKGAAGTARALLADNRPRIDAILGNVRDATATLELASGEIRRSPWRLLYRPDKSQSEQLDLYDTARRFAEGASDLNAAAEALRTTANDPNADPERVEALLAEIEAKFTEFRTVERDLYEKIAE